MSEMLERVAKAIDGVVGDDYELFLAERFPVSQAKDMREAAMAKAARAAIEAMREPTNEMLEDGIKALRTAEVGGRQMADMGLSFVTRPHLAVWRAMIDAALNEKRPDAL